MQFGVFCPAARVTHSHPCINRTRDCLRTLLLRSPPADAGFTSASVSRTRRKTARTREPYRNRDGPQTAIGRQTHLVPQAWSGDAPRELGKPPKCRHATRRRGRQRFGKEGSLTVERHSLSFPSPTDPEELVLHGAGHNAGLKGGLSSDSSSLSILLLLGGYQLSNVFGR
ncbi:hypothetical protein GN956_G2750 [Arapaima gigas]